LRRTDKTNTNRFQDTYWKETGQLPSAGNSTTDKCRLFSRVVTLDMLCSKLLQLLRADDS